MNKLLEEVLRELNPIHDLDNVRFYSTKNIELLSVAEVVELKLRNLAYIPRAVKPFARGALIGGALDAIAYYVQGESPAWGFTAGALIGGHLDATQYMLRANYKFLKQYMKDLF